MRKSKKRFGSYFILAIVLLAATTLWTWNVLADNAAVSDGTSAGSSGGYVTPLGTSQTENIVPLLRSGPMLIQAEKDRKIAAVAGGELTTAYATWWRKPSDVDDTNALQAAFDSRASTIIVEDIGQNWISEPLFVRKDSKTIMFEENVVLEAKRGSFKGTNDALLSVIGFNHVTLLGKGNVVLQMHREDYINEALGYIKGEWRHGIYVKQSSNILISGFTIKDTGGDGVGLSGAGQPENITVDDVHVERAHRNGLTVAGGRNILIKNSSFNYTAGTLPQVGVDVEAHSPTDIFENIRFENCDFVGNAAYGFVIALGVLDETSKPVSFTLDNVRIKDNGAGGLSIAAHDTFRAGGTVKVNHTNISSGHISQALLELRVGNIQTELNNMVLDTVVNAWNPIILSREIHNGLTGNTHFNNVVVKTDRMSEERLFWREIYASAKETPSFSGKITVQKSDGEIWYLDLSKYTKYYFPDVESSAVETSSGSANLGYGGLGDSGSSSFGDAISFTYKGEESGNILGVSAVDFTQDPITINLLNTTKVSATIFTEIERNHKFKKVVVKTENADFFFPVGSISGNKETGIYDFAISVNIGENVDKLRALAGNGTGIVVNFAHHGKLPGVADITFYVGNEYAGKKYHYYYYNDISNRLETVQQTTVDGSGRVLVRQSHCSSYILTSQKAENSVDLNYNPSTGGEDKMHTSLLLTLFSIGSVSQLVKRKIFK